MSTTQPQHLTLLPIGAGQPRSIEVRELEHIHAGWARFLEDGQRLIVNANEQGHSTRCYVLDLVGGKPKPVTPEGTVCGPSSPDSRYVVGVGQDSKVAIYPIGDSLPRSLPAPDAGFLPVQWSSDGTLLFGYHLGELPSRIYKVRIDNGKESFVQELRPGVPAGVVMVAPVVVNREGTRFAYSYNQTLSVLYLISGLR